MTELDIILEALKAVRDINDAMENTIIYGTEEKPENFTMDADKLIDNMWRHSLELRTDGEYAAIYLQQTPIWQSEDDDREWDDETDDYKYSIKQHLVHEIRKTLKIDQDIVAAMMGALSVGAKKWE